MAEIKNNENLTDSLSLSAEIQSKEEILKGKIASSILYFKGENGKSPYIGTNGNWFIYDDENKEWIDTGVNAVVDLSKYYTKTETDDKIKEVSDWINEQINKFYTKEEIDKKFEDLDIDISGKEDKANKVRQVDENDLDSLTEEQYLSAAASAHLIRGLRNAIDEKSDLSKEDIEEMLSDTFENIDAEINKKANSADSLAGYGIKDAYTKEEVDSKENILKGSIKNLQDKDVALAADIKKVEDKAGNLEKELITANSSIVSLTNDLNKINSNVEDLSSELEKSNIAIKENKENIETALTIAKGRATGYIFDTVADLDIWLSKKENTDNLVAGDNFYIKAIDVPDYWWDGVSKQQLETQKVDLDEYYNKQEIDNQIEPLQSDVGTLINFTDDLTKNISDIEKEFENYDSSIEVNRKINDLNNSVQDTFAAMQSEVIKKADKSKSLSGYGIEDAYTKEEIDDLIPEQIEVVNSLTSTDTDKALSANQGKILNDKITNLEETSAESNIPAIEVQLNETIPEGSLSSICDFEFKPTTPLCIYNLHDSNVRPNGQYFGQEIPFLTTTGNLVVKDSNDNIKIKKYIDSMINIVNDTYKWNVSDILTQNGLFKAWSGKFYLTMSEYTKRVDSGSTNSVYTFEFNESDFSKTGIPAKVDNIPIASPCFYPGTSNGTLFGGDPFKLKFFYNKETNKYVMEIRGYVQDNIFPQLQSYSKAYVYYQLETPYYEKEFLALGLEAGDKISFEHDYSYIQKYLDTDKFFKNGTDSGNLVINPDTTPMFIAKIPQNTKDALNGFNNAAKIFNEKESSASEEVAQDYSWIGDGDGATDYTSIIQNKIKELKSLSDGGTIYLGNGVYNISNFIEIYDNIKIIGTGNTVIQQTNKNTHMIIISGSNIMLKDLKLKLYAMSNEEKDNLEYNTELTACIYINSNNHKEYEWYDNRYLDNIYCKNLVMENIYLLGSYGFKYVDGKPSISNDYEHYRGCGLIQNNLFFNYASLNNIHINGMYHGLHGVGGSNDITIFCEACKVMSYGGGGYVNLNIYGHSYYTEDANGNTISMSDEIGYFTNMEQSCIAEYVYDVQWMKNIFVFEGLSMNNRYIASQYGGASYFANYDKGNIKLQQKIIDYGRGNRAIENFQNSPYHIGSKYIDQVSQTSFKQNDPITQNALSGAGVWGTITSNDAFNQGYLNLSDICRYPKPFQSIEAGSAFRSAVSEHSPTEENPIEILIDVSNRPINSIPGCFIQFDHSRIASDFKISFDITNTNIFTKEINVVNNMDVVWYFMQHQSLFNIIYKIKIVITKALYLESLKYQDSGYTKHEIEYNPDKKVGICNIGMIDSDFAGRAFLGECGGNIYGDLLLNKNSTIKNVPTPIDEGDAVNKKYADSVIGENKEDKSNRVSSGLALFGNDYHEDVSDDKYPTTKLAHEWAMEGYSLGSVANQRLDNNYYTKTEVDDKIDNIENNGSGNTIDVVDNLESTESKKALSANQGRVLDEKLQGVIYSRNILPSDYSDGNYKEHYGMTYEKLENGTVVATGKSNNASRYYFVTDMPIKAGSYTLSGYPEGDNAERFLIYRLGSSSSLVIFRTHSRLIEIPTDDTITIYMQYGAGAVPVEAQEWRVMLEKGTVTHDYVSPNYDLDTLQKTSAKHESKLLEHDKAINLNATTVNANLIDYTDKFTKMAACWVCYNDWANATYLAGSVIASGGYYNIFKITNNNYKFIRVLTATSDTGVCAIAFYSTEEISPESFMKSESIPANDYSGKGYDYYSAVIPDECKLIAISGRNDVEGVNTTIWLDTGVLLTEIERIEAPITYNFSNHITKGISHRGYIDAPENTISAFKLAKQKGFSFVECDTAITSDGVVVLLHDNTIDRTSNGTGNIAEMTFEEVRALDFGSKKNEKYAGEKIPSFEEFILYCRNEKLYPYIEIKSSATYPDEKLQEMVDIVRKYNMTRSCSWISFSDKYLKKIIDIEPESRVGFILQSDWTAGLATNNYISRTLALKTGKNEVFIDANHEGLTSEGIQACKNANMPIELWTVPASSFVNLDTYISGVTSDNGNYEEYLSEGKYFKNVADPIETRDAVNKQYVDTKIGDIDSVLDSILTLQSQY